MLSESPKTKPILLIDDDIVNLELLAVHTKAAGYKPLKATNGPDALVEFEKHLPQITIVDWKMPGMNGLEIVEAIRKQQLDLYVYIIMLTSETDKNKLIQAFESGLDDYLSKPFHEGELLSRIHAGERVLNLYQELYKKNNMMAKLNSDLVDLNEKLHNMAMTDKLTGLYNRHQAVENLNEYWNISKQYDKTFTLAIIDIDYFKQINDSFGHLKGDSVLCKIAELIKKNVRSSDTVYRIGGEEFLIIFPSTSIEKAKICCERCRIAVELENFFKNPNDAPVTISVGLCEYSSDMKDIDEFIKKTDLVLYQAKNKGRNQICFADTKTINKAG